MFEPYPEGAFVRTRFPFGPPDYQPWVPGPTEHIAYVLGHATGRAGPQMMLAYTSSGAWKGAAAGVPVGVINLGAAEAGRLNQRPFHLDLRCLARTLLTPAWFPHIALRDRGVVAVADRALRDRIYREAASLASRSPHVIEIRGVPP